MNEPPLDHWAWVRTGKGKSLHCVPGVLNEAGTWPDSFVEEGGMEAAALCGRSSKFYAPGIFTRMQAPRCTGCCDALGLQHGFGTPRNEKHI